MQSGAVLRGKYVMDRLLGQGACGAVWLARDAGAGKRRYAVKELLNTFTDPVERQEAIDLFLKEAGILSRLHHPSLPRIFDFFSEGQNYYLVMEFVPGLSLQKTLEQSAKPVPEAVAGVWALHILEVLEYLHRQAPSPVIFRDLKPSNIMVLPTGRLKLVDFGIARIFDPAKRADTVCLGTPGYAAPEQYPGSGRQSDPRSDLYALGVLLHQALTLDDPASHPFKFAPADTLNPDVSPEMTALLIKATSIAPADRFQNAGDFRTALEETLKLAGGFPPAAGASTGGVVPATPLLMRGALWLFHINGWLPPGIVNSCRFNPDFRGLLMLLWALSFFGWLETFLYFMNTSDPLPGTPGLLLGLTLLAAMLSRAGLIQMGVSSKGAGSAVLLGVLLTAGASLQKIKTALPEDFGPYLVHPAGSPEPSIALNTFQTILYQKYRMGKDSYIHDVWRYSGRDRLLMQIPSSDYRVEAIYLLPGTGFVTRKGLMVGDSARKVLDLYGAPEVQKHRAEMNRWFYPAEKMAVEIQYQRVQLIILARDFGLIREDYSTFLTGRPQ